MNILFVGSTRGHHCALYYFTSLVRLGHRVLPWDPEYFSAHSLIEKVSNKWHRGPSPAKRARIHSALVSLCRHNRFDAIFVLAENYLAPETIAEIRALRRPAPRFAFHSHDNLFADGILKSPDFFTALSTFDFLFTTKSQNVARYRDLGVKQSHFIPSAFEPTVHFPVPAAQSCVDREFPVGFIGTFDHSRERWLDAAGWSRLFVWGNGWRRFPRFDAMRERIQPNAVYYFEFADITSRTQCALGLLREEAEDLHTQRTFEIPACGALQFAPRNDEILSFYREHEEIVCFESPGELAEKLDHYLKHPDERRRLAERGRARTWNGGHTYVDRVRQMLELMGVEQAPSQNLAGRY